MSGTVANGKWSTIQMLCSLESLTFFFASTSWLHEVKNTDSVHSKSGKYVNE